MRLLGECPNCGAEDNIFPQELDESSGDSDSMQCRACNKVWGDWSDLTNADKDLIPFESGILKSDESYDGAEMTFPLGSQVPWIQKIRAILKAALMTSFDLKESLEWDDGHESFRLIDMDDRLGLELVGKHSSSAQLDKVLSFYLEMIGYLFNVPLVDSDGESIPIGQILRLSEEPENFKMFLEIVQLALARARGSEFAQEVIEKANIN